MVPGSYLLYRSFAFTPFNFRPAFCNPSFSALNGTSCDTIINAKHSTSGHIAFIHEWKLQPPSVRVNNRHDNVLRPATFVNATIERDTMLYGSYITMMSCERTEQASAASADDDDNVMLCECQTLKLKCRGDYAHSTVHKQCEVGLNFKCIAYIYVWLLSLYQISCQSE